MKAFLLLTCLAFANADHEDRAWWVDLELAGPLTRVTLDCGEAGTTTLELALLAGERRTVSVPVPARNSLGAAALSALHLPALSFEGAQQDGQARLVGWSAQQPTAALDALPYDLRARPRPPFQAAGGLAGLGELALLLAVLVTLVALRRRPLVALAVGSAAGLVLGLLALRRTPLAAPRQLLELESGGEKALLVTTARGELGLPFERLEVTPGHLPLSIQLELSGGEPTGRVLGPGARLIGLRTERRGGLARSENRLGALALVWVRGPAGAWSTHGPWPLGAALPAARAAGEGSVPPGWLVAGLPPGRAVCVGRLAGLEAAWVRATGFR